MNCRKCKKEIPEGSLYCLRCGAKQGVSQKTKGRGNGQGSAYQRPNKTWMAVLTSGYWTDETGKMHRIIKSKSGFKTKKDALDYLPKLAEQTDSRPKKALTFKQLYDAWLPSHRAGKDTLNCYKAAVKYFRPLWHVKLPDIDIDDLQECMDDCPRGKRTRENMKAACGLMYKYAIPRNQATLNLGQYLIVGDGEKNAKEALPMTVVEELKDIADESTGAAYTLCQCYLGFRPSEMLALNVEDYNAAERAFLGGAKTDAGRDRTVTVSPKIQPIIDRLIAGRTEGPVFRTEDGNRMSLKAYRALFYETLEAVGFENPITEQDGVKRRKYTPHSCRHTFATLMKSVDAPTTDKLKLIGHTTEAQLRYYQDTDFESLRAITDKL